MPITLHILIFGASYHIGKVRHSKTFTGLQCGFDSHQDKVFSFKFFFGANAIVTESTVLFKGFSKIVQ